MKKIFFKMLFFAYGVVYGAEPEDLTLNEPPAISRAIIGSVMNIDLAFFQDEEGPRKLSAAVDFLKNAQGRRDIVSLGMDKMSFFPKWTMLGMRALKVSFSLIPIISGAYGAAHFASNDLRIASTMLLGSVLVSKRFAKDLSEHPCIEFYETQLEKLLKSFALSSLKIKTLTAGLKQTEERMGIKLDALQRHAEETRCALARLEAKQQRERAELVNPGKLIRDPMMAALSSVPVDEDAQLKGSKERFLAKLACFTRFALGDILNPPMTVVVIP